MASETNNINDGTTSFHPSEPTLCANGCGFFGSSSTMNLCSKCFRDLRIEEEQVASAKVVVDKFMNQNQKSTKLKSHPESGSVAAAAAVAAVKEEKVVLGKSNRCLCCKKKVGVMGFECRCGSTFCGSHRYPEEHDCTFDFRGKGKEEIEKANPLVKGDKLGNRI